MCDEVILLFHWHLHKYRFVSLNYFDTELSNKKWSNSGGSSTLQLGRYARADTLSVALVRTRTIPTERPPPVGEVSANFCG